MRRDRRPQCAGKIADFFELSCYPIVFIGPHAVADGGQISDEIALILRRQTEVKDAIEMRNDLIAGVVPPIVKIRRVEIGVQQGWRLIQPARADIVLR